VNKKKPPKDASPARLSRQNTLPWLHSSRSAKESATGGLFSAKFADPVALLPEEPLVSEVQGLLNSAINVIECATGGHGRCANGACGCRCHKSRAPRSGGMRSSDEHER
jgi:hypothetical protein